jgi:ABC-type cobalamin/Fe3+-siderophores transport system ATPase subunit
VTPTGDTALALQADRVWFAYRNRDWVLRDVSLSIPAGQHTVIMGPSGTGKTTLLRVLAGILKPNEERVAVLGQPLLSFSMSYWANLRQGRQRCGSALRRRETRNIKVYSPTKQMMRDTKIPAGAGRAETAI